MKACGLIVEYNPFHNGHQYHIHAAREKTKADCIIAVMSGSFLQRGEPAIIDKFHRTKAALQSGVDIVIELPYSYAVQASDFFAKGAVLSLAALQVDSICFGSESGEKDVFLSTYKKIKANENAFNERLKQRLDQGDAYPAAYETAIHHIGLTGDQYRKPNNILGMSYVQTVLDHQLPIAIDTIKRVQNNYHDENITDSIASATSIRKQLLQHSLNESIRHTIPTASLRQMEAYYTKAEIWHHWDYYFPLLRYQIIASPAHELALYQGVDEGIEYRLKKHIPHVASFAEFVERVKTKRYTVPRIQRMLTHILTQTKKEVIHDCLQNNDIPYLRILGFNDCGRNYLQKVKKQIHVPVYHGLSRKNKSLLALEEKATAIYYSCLPPLVAESLRKQEFQLPIHL